MKLDFDSLPTPIFFPADYETILQESKESYEKLYYEETGKKIELAESDEAMIMLRTWAYRETLFRINANEAAKKNLLLYATGPHLDHLGSFYGVTRLESKKAGVKLLFTFQAPLPVPLLIGEVQVKTADSKLVFRVVESKTAPAGATSIEVTAECQTAGESGNGYPPGTISNLNTPLPYLESVNNSIESSGGADQESDRNFRERIYIRPDSSATTGSRDAYTYWTRTAHQDITDVALTSPAPGIVRVYPLLKAGELPDSPMLERVAATLNRSTIKTFTDKIEVAQPEIIRYSIEIELQIRESHIALSPEIMKKASRIVRGWQEELRIAMGRDIVPEELIRDLQYIEGVYRVQILSPAYSKIESHQVAQAHSTSINITGSVDE